MKPNDEDSGWRIGPFTIERKASFTAIAAFLLAIISFFSTIWSILFGSALKIAPDQETLFFAQRCYNKSINEITLEPVLGMVFYTTGPGTNSLVVTGAELEFTRPSGDPARVYFADTVVEYRPSTFDTEVGLFDTKRNCDSRATSNKFTKNGLSIETIEDFRPIVVEPGKSAVSGSLSFRPKYDSTDPTKFARTGWDEFLKQLKTHQESYIEFRIRPSIDNMGFFYSLSNLVFPVEIECRLNVNESLVAIAKEREFIYPSVHCE